MTLSGLVFPESVLTSPWFILLATVVAFNTIIYLGLTFSKFVPWPKQTKGAAIRQRLERWGAVDSPESSSVVSLSRASHLSDPYEMLRRTIANRDIPLSMALVGVAVILVSLVNLLILNDSVAILHVIQLLFGLLLLGVALAVGPKQGLGRGIKWLWALLMALLVGLLSREAVVDDASTPLAYALLVIVAMPSVTMAWTPSLVALALMVAPYTYATFVVADPQAQQLALAGLVGAGVGLVLLRMRLRAAMSIGEYWGRLNGSSTTDSLTGLLSRRGQRELLPAMVNTASMFGQSIWVLRVTVTNIRELNTIYGYQYGDEVLRAIARSATSELPSNTNIARWGGPVFVAVGVGQPLPEAEHVQELIISVLQRDPATLGKKQVELVVDVASGVPSKNVLDELVDSLPELGEPATPVDLTTAVSTASEVPGSPRL
jgi:diguanylate cyclase (GGDEF)-like protein